LRGDEFMLDNKGFDLWADSYDKSVDISDDKNDYPFAGYKKLMSKIYNTVMRDKKLNILDIGIGTGSLSAELYKNGYKITGIDFSEEMIKICKTKMPSARLIQHDFIKGLPEGIKGEKFDYIISTYALHHLNDGEKIVLIKESLKILDNSGSIIIGDIGFQTRKEFDECKALYREEWDDEYYFVFEEIKNKLEEECQIMYEQMSICAGIIGIKKIKTEDVARNSLAITLKKRGFLGSFPKI
jgi:putative AdoMet-dependent methyltransferase